MSVEVKEDAKSLRGVIESAHGLVHEISCAIEIGNIDQAKDQLKELDMLLHDIV